MKTHNKQNKNWRLATTPAMAAGAALTLSVSATLAASTNAAPRATGKANHAAHGNAKQHGSAAQKAASPSNSHGAPGHQHAGGHLHTTRLLFSSQPSTIQAGKTAKWTLKIVDDIDGTPIEDFDIVHDKRLHLLIASQDLSWFNHLHPAYKGNGTFELQTIIPHAGQYRLYADYKPKEREGEVGQQSFTVSGPKPLPAVSKLVPNKLNGAWMTRTVRSGPEGHPEKLTGPSYQVALMPMPAKPQAGKDVMLHFQVRDAKGKPLPKLERYLGAMGHLVLLSSDGNTYLHTHPMEGGHGSHSSHSNAASNNKAKGGSDVMFHTSFPKAGLYKAWGQFQHGGKIITAPFVLNVMPTARTTSHAAMQNKATQKATVTINGGYTPASLSVQAGKPVELTFVRKETVGCGDVVKIPAVGITTKPLKPGEKTTVKFTPKKSGTLRFTCGMNMYSGQISVK